MINLLLKRGKAKPVWTGHPWVYSGAVERTEGAGSPGELASVTDHNGTLIGWGHYSPEAQIAFRLWAFAPQTGGVASPPEMASLLRTRLREAIERRRRMGLPSEQTTGYRLINSEGDRMPGVTVDVYGSEAVALFGTPGAAAWQSEVARQLRESLGLAKVHCRVSADAVRLEQVALPDMDDVPDFESRGEAIEIREEGIPFLIDPAEGQKTGFFLDQRENRLRVAGLARGKRLLDVCSFGGAFSLHALHAGAHSAVAIDTSPRAERMALASAERAGVPMSDLSPGAPGFLFDRRDAFVALKERAAAGERYDIVVVDPPKFARSRRELDAALQKYGRLNELALRCLAEGGLLVSCSCSRHVSAESLERTVAGAAQRARVLLHLVGQTGLPADHPTPAGFAEGRYLKALYFTLSARD